MTRVGFLVLLTRLSAGAVVYVDADAGGLDTGSSWTDAYTDLRSALAAAVSGDEIWVAEGTYKPTSGADRMISFALADGVALYGGFAGTESARGERDWIVHETILSGDIGIAGNISDNSYHVVLGASNATLDGLTMASGRADGGGIDNRGAGMCNDSVDGLVVANCTFSGNSVSNFGAGMYNEWSSPVVVNCTFSANAGGGMFNSSYSSPTVTGCTFSGNSGAGMCNGNSSSPDVTSCAFLGNMAAFNGGGMYNYDWSSPTVSNCTFSGNAAGEKGGGMHNDNSSPTVTNCTFCGNTAGVAGGGMCNTGSSPAVTNCILWGDSAPSQPEIWCDIGYSCTVSYSDVQGGGGSGAGWNVPFAVDDGGNIDADPLFADADGVDNTPGTLDDDLRLLAGSPCLDTGSAIGAPAADLVGLVRPQAGGVDMGAYERPVGNVLYVRAGAAGLNDGSSWTDAYPNLQTALANAVAGDEIWVAEGVYEPTSGIDRAVSFQMKANVGLYGGFSGTPGTEGDRAGRDPAAYVTALTGDIGVTGDSGDNSYHVVLGADNATLDGFTVTGGRADGAAPDYGGGGMLNDTVTGLAVANCTFSDNSATAVGGAIVIASCSPLVTNCIFLGNVSESGGGIYTTNTSSPALLGCTFSGNAASYAGGAIYNRGSPTVDGCTFWKNSADRYGGAVYCSNNSSPALANCTFSGNAADKGAAISSNWASPTVTNCTFSGNAAASEGGGIFNDVNTSLTITNCTFSGNTAVRYGAGMSNNSATAAVTNCVLWGDSAPSSPEICGGGSTVGYSNVAQVGGFTDAGGNINADPLFVDPDGPDDTAGSPDDDLRLQAGSPCIDAADGDAAPPQDMDGNPRHNDTGVTNTGAGAITYADMGAYEFQGTTPAEWCVVSEPHPGAAWKVGTGQIIRWAASAGVTDVKIELSRDGGAVWGTIEASTPNDGSHPWTVVDGGEALPQMDCLVRVSDVGGGGATDTSDAFAIFSGVWHVDPDAPGPAHDGFSWATAFVHPQDAVDRAAAGEEVRVAAGAYVCMVDSNPVLLRMKKEVAIYGGYAGYGEPTPDQRDLAAYPTTLDGEGDAYHVVVGAQDASLDGFIVTGGSADLPSWDCGAGMFNNYISGITVANCVFSSNAADKDGGGIYNCACDAILTNCAFSGNTAGSRGGGIYNFWLSSSSLTNCTFADNGAGESGGGLYAVNNSPVPIANSILWGNSAPSEPEIYCEATSPCTVSCSDVAQVGGFTDGGGNVDADPLFVDMAGDDLRLLAGSPCIDAADGNVDPDTDIDGNARWDDPGMDDVGTGNPTYVDIGAFEFQGASTPVIAITAPASGASWAAGAAQTIAWTTTGGRVLNVRVEFARDGVTWEYIDGGAPVANAGTLDWTPAGPASADCLVRVKDAVDSVPAGTSDFTITEPLTVTLSQSAAEEGDGVLGIGTVSVPTPVSGDLSVGLLSSDESEVTVPGTVTILDGQTSALFDVTVADDGVVDGPRTAAITASAAAYVSSQDNITVNDNDPLRLTITSPAAEGDGSASGTVELDESPESDLAISFASSDPSEAGNPAGVTVTTAATSQAFSISVVDDLVIDGPRTVTITASAAGCADGAGQIVVNDNDPLRLTLVSPATEGDATALGTVEFDEVPEGTLTISFGSGDLTEAGNPSDVVLTGETSQNFSVPVVDDLLVDGPRTVTITAGAAGCTDGSAQLVVNDNDPLTVAIASPTAEGDGSASGTVGLDEVPEADLTISFVSSDLSEASNPADAVVTTATTSQIVSVPVVDDLLIDGPRTATITASAAGCADGTGVLVVNDNDPVYLSLPSQATEGEAALVGTIEVDEEPTADVDFALVSDDTTELTVPIAVTIQAGQLSATFLVTPVEDGEIDGDQTATVTASLAGWADGAGSMTVLDNETQSITLTLPASASEGDDTLTDAGTVSIPGTYATDLVVTLSSDDMSELDVPGTVTITAGQASATFDLIVVDDALVDGARPVTVTASLAGWGDGVASLTVLDDEVGTFVVTLPASSTEGEAGLTGTVEMPLALLGDLTVTLQSDDETELTVQATVDIVAGQTLASFPLTVADDAGIDGLQQATVTASAAGWNPGSDTMDVLDNETQTLTLTLPASATEGDGTLAGAGSGSIPGTWPTDLVIDLGSDDTAELAVPLTVTIPQGDTSATFDLTVETDGVHDGTQTVTVTASAAGWTGSSADMEILDIDPAPKKGGCASGAGIAFCILIPYLARRRRRRAG